MLKILTKDNKVINKKATDFIISDFYSYDMNFIEKETGKIYIPFHKGNETFLILKGGCVN